MPSGTYRYVYSTFWDDNFTQSIAPEEKYFYLYTITNPHTNQCGIYQITQRTMAFETGYDIETIDKLLKIFTSYKKIFYNPETSELFVVNWLKYNGTRSPKIAERITNELKEVKTDSYRNNAIKTCLKLGYPIDTLSLPYQEQDIDIDIDKDIDKDIDIDIDKERKTSRVKPDDGLPDWINKETWKAFLEVRRKLKAPSTVRAIELTLKDLQRFKEAGDDPNEILNQSIKRGWRGVFPLRKDGEKKNIAGKEKGNSDANTQGSARKSENLDLHAGIGGPGAIIHRPDTSIHVPKL